ncbi:MAG: aryl-sulfate sulfotransferase [Bacteroidales bacterium]|nr:aryl-sulfate sulfotransferase [Bacteroidales bacterium]
MKPRLFLILLLSFQVIILWGQTQTMGCMQNDTLKTYKGYTLFAPKQNTMTYLINNEGRKIHEWNASTYPPGQSVYLLENGHLLRACMTPSQLGTGGGEGGRIEEYDWDDNLVWELDYSTSTYMQHHDIKKLPNGNVIMLVVEKKTYAQVLATGFDPSKLNPEIQQKGYMLPDCIIEIQPTYPSGGTVVWEWHVWDHLVQDYDPSKANYGVVAAHPELIDCDGDHRILPLFWNHMNCIDYNPALDQIAMSVRGNSEIWIVDHSTTTAQASGHTGGLHAKGGDLLYRWGNPLTYGAGNISNRKYFEQHDVEWVRPGCPGAGNLTCYNNGLGRTPLYSTIDEIMTPIDLNGNYPLATGSAWGPVDFTWSYTANPPESLYSENISGAQRQPNGNTIICEGGHGDFTEVTSTGELVWRYICPVNDNGPMYQGSTIPVNPVRPDETMNSVFRIYRYAPDYPAFTGKTIIPGDFIELYQQSTGDVDRSTWILLRQNFPNPSSLQTKIGFRLFEASLTRLSVLDIAGRELAVMADGRMEPGNHEYTLDVSGMNDGIYLVCLESGIYREIKRMTVMKEK